MRRGVSTLLAAVLVSAVALAAFASLYTMSQRRVSTSIAGLDRLADYVHQHEVTRLVIVVAGGVARVRNLGNKPVELEYLVLLRSDRSLRAVKLTEGDPCWRLDVDGSCEVDLEDGVPVVAVTRSGIIVYPERVELLIPPSEAALVIPVTFFFGNIVEFAEEFGVDPGLVAKPYPGRSDKRGINGTTVLLLPRGRESEYFNELVSTVCPGSKDGRTPFGVLVVGYDPSWVIESRDSPGRPPRFSILFAGPRMPGEKICTSREALPLTQQGFRVKILNFTGTVRIYDSGGRVLACSSSIRGECGSVRSALGVWYYGIGLGWTVYFHGIAGYFAYYQRAPSGRGQQASYEPYLFLGDIDGNGVVDLLLVTEDAYYGSYTKIDDSEGNEEDLVDYSTEPLRLKLLGVGRALGYPDGSIDGGRYAGIFLYINLLFHDNSHPDEDQLRDVDRTDWVLRVLLVDELGNEYVVREYRYQEICNYHKTLVRDVGRDNYFVKISQSIYLPIPSSGRYWIAIELADPYYYEKRGSYYVNDADLSVGIEIIGVLPLAR